MVKVKALEWRVESAGYYWSAPSALGRYHLTHYRGMQNDGFKLDYGGGLTSYFSSMPEAKAAAQADYDERILSALELE